jgi:ABC-type phosphate/phosphonate transport system permease subunit
VAINRALVVLVMHRFGTVLAVPVTLRFCMALAAQVMHRSP